MRQFILTFLFLFVLFKSFAQDPFKIGDPAPDFEVTDFKGNVQHLYTYCGQGKYVLIDFFTYWCQSCLLNSQVIDAFYHKYGCNQGNVIVFGNECDPTGTVQKLLSFILESGGHPNDTYPQWAGVAGGNTIGSLYQINGYPSLVIVAPDSTFLVPKIMNSVSLLKLERQFPEGVLSPMECSLGVSTSLLHPDFYLYPNPASDNLFVEFSLPEPESVSVQVFDLIGTILLEFSGLFQAGDQKILIYVQNLDPGFYLVKTSIRHQVVASHKLVIQR